MLGWCISHPICPRLKVSLQPFVVLECTVALCVIDHHVFCGVYAINTRALRWSPLPTNDRGFWIFQRSRALFSQDSSHFSLHFKALTLFFNYQQLLMQNEFGWKLTTTIYLWIFCYSQSVDRNLWLSCYRVARGGSHFTIITSKALTWLAVLQHFKSSSSWVVAENWNCTTINWGDADGD